LLLAGEYGFGVFQKKWLERFEANQKLMGLCASVVVVCLFSSLLFLFPPQTGLAFVRNRPNYLD
jgi:hypothetical protein